MAKRLNTKVALTAIVLSSVIAVGSIILIPNLALSKNKSIQSELPVNGALEYIEAVKQSDYQAIYDAISTHGNTYDTLDSIAAVLEKTYENYDINSLEVVEDSNDSTLFHLVSDNTLIHDIQTTETDQGWIGYPLISGNTSITIEILSGSELSINTNPVDTSLIVNEGIPATIFNGIDADKYTEVPTMDQYLIENLFSLDSVEIDGQACSIMHDVLNDIYYCGSPVNTTSISDVVIASAKALASYPAQEGSVGQVGQYSLQDASFYTKYKTMENTWYTAHSSAVFSNETIHDAIDIGNNCIISNVSLDYDVTGSLGEKTYNIGFQMSLYPSNDSYKLAGLAVDSRINPLYESE